MKKQNNVEKTTGLNWAKVTGTILTACFLSLGTVTFAQERENVGNADVDEFGQYDANQDQQMDRDEFNTRMGESETYNQWDADRSGDIDENEFNEGVRNQQNQGDQQGVNTQDNTTGTTGTTGANDYGTFQDWDTDQSGTIDQDEFNEVSYDRWDMDRDGRLNSEEFNRGININSYGNDPGLYNGTGTQPATGTEQNDAGDTEINTESETGNEVNDASGTEMNETPDRTQETGSEPYLESEETDLESEGTQINSEVGGELK